MCASRGPPWSIFTQSSNEIAQLTRQASPDARFCTAQTRACYDLKHHCMPLFALETLVIALDTTQKIIGGTKPAHPGTTHPAIAPDAQHTRHRYMHRCYADVYSSIPRLAGSQVRSHAVWPLEVSRRQSDMGSSVFLRAASACMHMRSMSPQATCSMDLPSTGCYMQLPSAMCPCAQAAVSRSLKFKTRSYHQPTARSTSPACPCEHGATHSPWKQRSSGDVEI